MRLSSAFILTNDLKSFMESIIVFVHTSNGMPSSSFSMYSSILVLPALLSGSPSTLRSKCAGSMPRATSTTLPSSVRNLLYVSRWPFSLFASSFILRRRVFPYHENSSALPMVVLPAPFSPTMSMSCGLPSNGMRCILLPYEQTFLNENSSICGISKQFYQTYRYLRLLVLLNRVFESD